MFRNLVFSAAAAGLIAGLVVAVLHHLVTVPIILHAESYEKAAVLQSTPAVEPAIYRTTSQPKLVVVHGDAHATGPQAGWSPTDGVERSFYTFLTTALLAIGFSLALLGAMVLRGAEIGPRQALGWGLAGFAAVILAPSLGLAPELPGASAAGVEARQVWWMVTVIATLGGMAAIAFGGALWWQIGGVVLIAAPHIVGAPHAHQYASQVPAELAAHFASASIAINAVLWILVGWLSGTFYLRFAGPQDAQGSD